MNQFFAAGIALVFTMAVLGLGRKPKKFAQNLSDEARFTSQTTPLQTTTLLHQAEVSLSGMHPEWKPPNNHRESYLLKKELFRQIELGPEDRLKAVSAAALWGHPSVLSIIRRGLRDSDSRVVIIAAEAIKRFRG